MDGSGFEQSSWFDGNDIADEGERVSHLNRDSNFFAHLSIYDFAVPFCQQGIVMDAGCGAGYGSDLFAQKGARHVFGIDASRKAIEFSRHHFQRPNLSFEQMKLEQVEGFAPKSLDFIFSSQTLEHVPEAAKFIRTAGEVLKPDGVFLVAVPTITDNRFLYLNVANPYHVNIWSPRQWEHVLMTYFASVDVVLHGVRGIGRPFEPEDLSGSSRLTERDFCFRTGTIRDMYGIFSLNAIFVARAPRPHGSPPGEDAPIDFVDGSFTRAPGVIDPPLRQALAFYFEMSEPWRLLTEADDPGKGVGDSRLLIATR